MAPSGPSKPNASLADLLNPKSTLSSWSTILHVAYLKRWTIVTLWLLLGIPLGLFLIFFDLPKTYVSQAYLRFPHVVGVDDQVMRDVALREKESIVRLFQSYNVLHRTIDDLGLKFRIRNANVFRHHVIESIGGSGYAPGLYTFKFGSERRLKVYAKPYGKNQKYLVYNDKVPNDNSVSFSGVTLRFKNGFADISQGFDLEMVFQGVEEALKTYRDRIEVSPLDQGPASVNYSVTLEDRDPVLVAEIVNRLTDNFMAVYTRTTQGQDRTVLAQLEKSLELAREKQKRADLRLDEFYRANPQAMYGPQGTGFSTAQASSNHAEISRNLERLEQTLSRKPASGAPEGEKLLWIDEALSLLSGQGVLRAEAMRTQLSNLESEKSRLSAIRTPTHPDYLALDRKMAGMIEPVEELARQTRESYRVKVRDTEATVRRNPSAGGGGLALQMEARRLHSEKDEASQQVQNLEMQFERARLTSEGDLFAVTIIDRARPALHEELGLRERVVMASGAGVVTLFPGFLWVVALQLLFPRVYNRDDANKKFGIKVLGSLFAMPGGKSRDRKGKNIDPQLLYHGSAYRITDVEAFRALRVELESYFRADGHHLGLMVTSTQPNEGKSLVSANLAISFARKGCRTLLIDADFRHGRLENMFGLRPEKGLVDILRKGDIPQHEVLSIAAAQHIVRTPQSNLYLLSKGNLDEYSEEAFYGQAMENLMRRLQADFDVVLVDTAPVIVTADPVKLAEWMRGVVYVIRSGQPSASEISKGLERFTDRNVPIGCVINDIRKSPTDDNHYARYGYYYAKIPHGGSGVTKQLHKAE